MGVESRPITRLGFVPADGPEQWTAGMLFPLSSKKVARAINAASGSRPVVILANFSGFDGSPESLRRLQLEYGAEIGRAVVEFRWAHRFLRHQPLPRRRLRRVLAAAGESERGRLRVLWHELYEAIHSEKLGEVADEFDQVHDVSRAQRVGSLDDVVAAGALRPYLIEAVERGIRATKLR